AHSRSGWATPVASQPCSALAGGARSQGGSGGGRIESAGRRAGDRPPRRRRPQEGPMTEQLPTTARDLMSPNPRSIQGGATVPEVLAFLTDTGFSAAPVLDEAGRPVGVLS